MNLLGLGWRCTRHAEAQGRAQIQAVKLTVDEVSDDSFRTVITAEGDYEGSGDCGTFYFLDKTNVYGVSNCEGPGVPSLSVVKYQKI